MKLFSAFSLLSAKLFLLSCFGFMGSVSFAAEQISPCHQEPTPAAEEFCDACEAAEKTWSESTVLDTEIPEIVFHSKYTLPDFIADPPPHQLINSPTHSLTSPDPPEIITKTIQLRI